MLFFVPEEWSGMRERGQGWCRRGYRVRKAWWWRGERGQVTELPNFWIVCLIRQSNRWTSIFVHCFRVWTSQRQRILCIFHHICSSLWVQRPTGSQSRLSSRGYGCRVISRHTSYVGRHWVLFQSQTFPWFWLVPPRHVYFLSLCPCILGCRRWTRWVHAC